MRLFILAIKFKGHLARMDNDNPLKYYFNILKLKKIKSSKSLASKILNFNFMEYKYVNILPYEYKIVNKNKNIIIILLYQGIMIKFTTLMLHKLIFIFNVKFNNLK